MIQQQLSQRRPTSRQSSFSRRFTDRPLADQSGNSSPVSRVPQQRPQSGHSVRGTTESPTATGGKWTVMVFGKTGAGKSHLANLMIGYNAFASCDSLASVTNDQSVRKAVSSDGRLTVLDTIGFGDTKLPPELVVRSLRDTSLEAPDGID